MNDLADIADPARPLLKLAVPPSRLIEAFSVVEAESERTEFPAVVWAHAGVGIVYARFESCEWSEAALDRLAQLSRALRGFAVERRGSLVVETCPAGLKRRLDVWGDVGPSLRLMRSLKQQLDPRGTLNAGRYVGGI